MSRNIKFVISCEPSAFSTFHSTLTSSPLLETVNRLKLNSSLYSLDLLYSFHLLCSLHLLYSSKPQQSYFLSIFNMSLDRRELVSSAITSLRQAQNSLEALLTLKATLTSQSSPNKPTHEYGVILFEVKSLVNRLSDRLFDEITGTQASSSSSSRPSQPVLGISSTLSTSKPISSSSTNVPLRQSLRLTNQRANELHQISAQPSHQPKAQQGFFSEEKEVNPKPTRNASTPKSYSASSKSLLSMHISDRPRFTPSPTIHQSTQSWRSETSTVIPSIAQSPAPLPPRPDDINASLLAAAQRAAATTQAHGSVPKYRPAWRCFILLNQVQGKYDSITSTHDLARSTDQQAYALRTILVHAVGPSAKRTMDIAPSISFQLDVVDDYSAWKRARNKSLSAHDRNVFSITFPVSNTVSLPDRRSTGIKNFRCRCGDELGSGDVPSNLCSILRETYGADYWSRLVCFEWDCEAALREDSENDYRQLIGQGMKQEVYTARSLFLKASGQGGRLKVFVIEDGNIKVPQCWKGKGFDNLCNSFGLVAPVGNRGRSFGGEESKKDPGGFNVRNRTPTPFGSSTRRRRSQSAKARNSWDQSEAMSSTRGIKW